TFIDPIHAPRPMPPSGGADLIDWPSALRAKRAALQQAFAERGSDPAFAAFAASADKARSRHAQFNALSAYLAERGVRSWRAWPEDYRHPATAAVEVFARDHSEDIRRELFFQWLGERALDDAQTAARDAGMAIGIVTDIAVGADPNGSDAWAMGDAVLQDLTVGAPPDIFNRDGQNWGVTALSPSAMPRNGYAAFLAMLRAAMRHAGGVRIDHMMGFERLWLIPHGAKPTEGVYLRFPLHELLLLTAL